MNKTEDKGPCLIVDIEKGAQKVLMQGNYEGWLFLRNQLNKLLELETKFVHENGKQEVTLTTPELGGEGLTFRASDEEWFGVKALKIVRWE